MVVERYHGQSQHYYENALKFLQEGEPQKAAEFLWGTMAETFKAIAASRGRELRTHREIWDYAREVAKELNDESIWFGFKAAHSLHSDFYEAGLTLDDVKLEWETLIRPTLDKLTSLLP